MLGKVYLSSKLDNEDREKIKETEEDIAIEKALGVYEQEESYMLDKEKLKKMKNDIIKDIKSGAIFSWLKDFLD